ncbi:methylamine utilization protein MauE [Actinoplanes sichuanensis]|uniref:MauE/DoxX family redox-associated membrane protein n=1 Tax=Actinoplanes sichuanensis TaxID=512349 RepID=A0ABW4ABN2_9ACTN|nr:MauE/DoxX family redox-associated membrane protein [Actinoplanes sichuanensis]BEL05301.1 methylamine utilization protein MauE [Actinoplanes sichuanensis]
MSYALVGARVLIGLVFAVSAVTKLRAFAAFRVSLAAMRVVPRPLVGPVAVGVVAAESAIPVLLLVPGAQAAGFVVAVLLLAAFSAGIARVLATGTTASCRCFGVSAAPFGRHHLYRNAVLTVVAAAGLIAAVRPGQGPAPAGAAVAAGAAAVAALVVVMLDDIVELFRPEQPAVHR